MARTLDMLGRLLVIVGALNWGLVAVFEFDLVAWIFGLEFGETNAISRVVYGLVGVSAIWLVARAALSPPAVQLDRMAPHRAA